MLQSCHTQLSTQLLYSLKEFVQSEQMHEDGAEPMFV